MLLTQKVASEDIEMRAFRWALQLTAFTIGYNFLEGTVSTLLGFQDETLALFGFGVDSFIEVISRNRYRPYDYSDPPFSRGIKG